jgi:hypothetical protein
LALSKAINLRLAAACTITVSIIIIPTSNAAADEAGTGAASQMGLYYGAGIDFLLIQANVRSRGMGEAAAALPNNPGAFVTNPACLTDAHTVFFEGSTAEWLPWLFVDGMRVYYFNAGTTIKNAGSFGIAVQHLAYGEIKFTDAMGKSVGSLSPYWRAYYLGYAAKIHRRFAIGANIKLIKCEYLRYGYPRPYLESLSSYGIDIGLRIMEIVPQSTYTTGSTDVEDKTGSLANFARRFAIPRQRGISFGLIVQNIGPDIKPEGYVRGVQLPRNLKLGFAYQIMDTDKMGFLIAADINRSIIGHIDDIDEFFTNIDVNLGTELNFFRLFDVRIGYIRDRWLFPRTITYGFSFGMDKFRFNFSRIPDVEDAGPYAETTFFGVSVNF